MQSLSPLDSYQGSSFPYLMRYLAQHPQPVAGPSRQNTSSHGGPIAGPSHNLSKFTTLQCNVCAVNDNNTGEIDEDDLHTE